MGYRSNVAIGLPERVWAEKIKKRTEENENIFGDFHDIIDETIFTKIGDVDHVIMLMDSVKWYDEYSDVQFFMNTYHNIELGEGEFKAFIRTGEELEDNEILDDPWEFEMYISRTIETPTG